MLIPERLTMIALLCAAIGLATARRAQRVVGRRTALTLACAAMLVPPALGLTAGAVDHANRKRVCLQVLEHSGTLSPAEAEALRNEGLRLRTDLGPYTRIDQASMDGSARQIVEKVLVPAASLPHGADLRVLVPLGDASYLMLWRTPSFTYCDIRALTNGGTEIIGLDFVQELLAADAIAAVSLPRYLDDRWLRGASPNVYAGRILRHEHHRPLALVVAGN